MIGGGRMKRDSWLGARANRRLVLVTIVVLVAAGAYASSAHAIGHVVEGRFSVARPASAGRVVLHSPGDVYVGTRVQLSGSVTGVKSGDRILLQVRRGSRWRSVAQARLRRSARSFALVLRAPTRAGSVRVRAVMRRAQQKVRAVSEVRLLVVVLRPLVLTPGQVVSVPAPGKAGWITLRSGESSQGGRARAATVCVPLTQYAKRGQIVAVGWSPQTRAGFLGKINLTGCNGFYASPVPLNQATVNGDTIDWSHPLQVVGNSLTKKTQSSFSQAITNNLSCNAGTTATLTGTFDAAITPSLKASFSWFRLTSGAFALTASADASLKLHVQGTAGCTFTKSLPSIQFGTFEVQMGPLPVVVVLQGSLGVVASVQAGTTFDADIAAHAQTTGGVSYDSSVKKNGGFAAIYSRPLLTFPTKTVSFTGTANGHLYVQPAIQALLYGAAGAKVMLSTGLDFNANTSIDPWWSLTAPLQITGALTIPGLDKSTSFFPIYTKNPEFPIVDAGGPFPGVSGASVSITNPGNQTSAVGTQVNLQIQASDTDGGTLNYSATGLPGGLSINQSTGLITGTPTTAGTSSTTVVATDASGPTGSTMFTWTIGAPTGSGPPTETISAGSIDACAILSGGGVDCWGGNNYGQLGDGSTPGPDFCAPPSGDPCSMTPTPVTGIANASQISAGDSGACALLSNGSIECWGGNNDGELGSGASSGPQTCTNGATTACSTTPVAVSGITDATQVAVGGSGTACALIRGGSVSCWGNSANGELGIGNDTGPTTCATGQPCSPSPASVNGITSATQVSVGEDHACALLRSGVVMCWGDNNYGELGVGTSSGPQTCVNGNACSKTPVQVSSITSVTQIAAGGGHTCALLSGGGVDCWGLNADGELGTGSSTGPSSCSGQPCSTTPVPVSMITNANAIRAHLGEQTCALLVGGQLDCWGDNAFGQLGVGTTSGPGSCAGGRACSTAPVVVSIGGTAAQVTVGKFFVCAQLSDNSAKCWGDNFWGELGDGTTSESDVPVAVSGIS
jgi:alpha-tubulin suppressor-like RCC1 family protein